MIEGRSAARLNHELTARLSAAVVDVETAVVGKGAGAVGAELERDGLAGSDALGNAVIVDREAVRDVARVQLDLDEIVLIDFDARWVERVAVYDDRERLRGRTLILGRR